MKSWNKCIFFSSQFKLSFLLQDYELERLKEEMMMVEYVYRYRSYCFPAHLTRLLSLSTYFIEYCQTKDRLINTKSKHSCWRMNEWSWFLFLIFHYAFHIAINLQTWALLSYADILTFWVKSFMQQTHYNIRELQLQHSSMAQVCSLHQIILKHPV